MHINFFFLYSPVSPDQYNWAAHYPAFFPTPEGQTPKRVELADIGCGYGGLIGAFYDILFFLY